MRIALKSITVIVLLLLFCLSALLLALLPAGKTGRRALLTRNISFFSRLVLRALGTRIRTRRRGHHPMPDQGCLVVANHVTYVDILVLAALRPSVFITSVELRHTFPLGTFAWLGGSVFVERRSPAGLRREIRNIEAVLRSGLSVVLFPEGTTSNGETVQPFKNSLFTAAIAAGKPVLPICLRYRRADGQRITDRNRDGVYYYGDTSFAVHAPKLLSLRTLHVDCITLDPIPTHHGQSRKELAARCHEAVKTEYHRVRAPHEPASSAVR